MTRNPTNVGRSTELELTDLALELFESQSKSGIMCPFCKGGATGETTLFMRRDGRYVYYKCYRAKCGASGRVNVKNHTADVRIKELGGKRRVLETSPSELDQETRDYLVRRYHFTPEEIRRAELGITLMHSHQAPSRLYIPMFRRDGTPRGYTARDLTGLEDKKAMSYKWKEDEPNLAWYNNRRSKSLIIVEDCFSGLRASTYINSCALLGVTLDKAKVDEIMRAGFTEAYIALDKDATRVAIKQSIEHRTRLRLRVIALEKDIKDMEPEELKTFMEPLIDARS